MLAIHVTLQLHYNIDVMQGEQYLKVYWELKIGIAFNFALILYSVVWIQNPQNSFPVNHKITSLRNFIINN